MAREAAAATGKEVGILGDLPGPKLRIDDVEAGIVGLRPGSEITLTTDPVLGTEERLSVSFEGLPGAVAPGGAGLPGRRADPAAVVDACGDREVRCTVEVGGRVASHQGLNLPGRRGRAAGGRARGPRLGRLRGRARASTCSRSRSCAGPRTSTPVERRVRTAGADIPVIAKIEKPQAAERAEEIVKAVTAGIMVARGDLGIELPIEQVPIVQRRLLRLAGQLLAAIDHRDPDARLDGRLPAADPGRGLRRRERDHPGHRRRDALRGDRDRRVPGRGGRG